MTTSPHIDTAQVSEVDKRNLAAAFLLAAQEFYADPENLKRFEAWKQARVEDQKEANYDNGH